MNRIVLNFLIIEGYKEGPLLIIDVDNNNFAENEEDLGGIITKIDAELYGLFK